MDHIPTPRAPRYEPPEVLCYVRVDFSCSGSPSFHGYPESRNWKHQTFVNGDFRQGHTERESREFLQEWLYFKFLAAVFASVGIEIDMDDFTRLKDGQLLIDSTNLIRYISKFEGNFREMEPQAQMTSVKEISLIFRTVQRLIVRECSMASSSKARSESWPFDPVTSLSFMVLGCTVNFAVSRIVQVLHDKNQALQLYKQLHISHEAWGTSKLLYQRMIQDNWCPHNLAQFASGGYSILGMYYASLLEIPSDGNDHSKCKVRNCNFTIVDEKTYKPRHTHPPPDCAPAIPVLANIIQSLKSKCIPLLRIRKADDGTVQVDVHPYKDGIKYVAISHVWAHGMGNVEGNWLPSCQMRRFSELSAALYPFSSAQADVYLWIDTVCVPRPMDIGGVDYRRVAIDLLEDTYKKADKVLVLDDQLVRSSSRTTAEENLVRILSSGWMTRLWTLQEGLLAGKLRFQFQERALDAEDMLSDIMPIHHSSVWQETYEFFSTLRLLRTATISTKLRYFWNYLQWRSTSHESDEQICLSILTGKKPSVVSGLLGTDRMKAFLKQIEGVPSDIIFMPGPRLPDEGWKWAPTSFMARYQWTAYEHFQESVIPGASNHTMSEQTNASQHYQQGLRVRFPGINLSKVPSNLDLIFRVEETRMKRQFLVVALYDRCPPEWKDIDLTSIKNPTLILQAYPQAYGAIHAIFVDAYEQPGLDGQVPLDRTARLVTPVRFLCRANVSFVEPVSQETEDLEAYFHGDELVSRRCQGQLLDQQWWYVG